MIKTFILWPFITLILVSINFASTRVELGEIGNSFSKFGPYDLGRNDQRAYYLDINPEDSVNLTITIEGDARLRLFSLNSSGTGYDLEYDYGYDYDSPDYILIQEQIASPGGKYAVSVSPNNDGCKVTIRTNSTPSFRIEGPSSVYAGNEYQYRSYVVYPGGVEDEITQYSAWSATIGDDPYRYKNYMQSWSMFGNYTPGKLNYLDERESQTESFEVRCTPYHFTGGWVEGVSKSVQLYGVSGVSIDGPESVPENSNALFIGQAHYADGHVENVTRNWSLYDSRGRPYVGPTSIGEMTGEITTQSVEDDTELKVSLFYAWMRATKDIVIKDGSSNAATDPGGIGEISFNLVWGYDSSDEGPDIDLHVIDPNGNEIYFDNPAGHFDLDDQGETGAGNGSGPERAFWDPALSGTYTYFARWYRNASYASAANLTLRVYRKIDGLQQLQATNQYTLSASNTESTRYTHTVPGRTLEDITILGPTSINEGETRQYSCQANYSDGTNEIVTASWSLNSPYASVGSGGMVTASSVSSDQPVTLIVTHGGKQNSKQVTIKANALDITELALVADLNYQVNPLRDNSWTISGNAIDRDGNLLPDLDFVIADPVGAMSRVIQTDRYGRFSFITGTQSGDPNSIYIFDVIWNNAIVDTFTFMPYSAVENDDLIIGDEFYAKAVTVTYDSLESDPVLIFGEFLIGGLLRNYDQQDVIDQGLLKQFTDDTFEVFTTEFLNANISLGDAAFYISTAAGGVATCKLTAGIGCPAAAVVVLKAWSTHAAVDNTALLLEAGNSAAVKNGVYDDQTGTYVQSAIVGGKVIFSLHQLHQHFGSLGEAHSLGKIVGNSQSVITAKALDVTEIGVDLVEQTDLIYEVFTNLGIIGFENNWYSGASPMATGWRYFDWFKGFKPQAGSNWIFHGRHGWLYVLADDTSGMFLWDGALGRWMFTNETTYPWMYAYGPDEGWVFFFEGGRPGARFFKRGDTGEVVSELQLGL